MIGNLKLSLCTRFKDRLSHLSQTLPTWVKNIEIDEFIITDYNSQKDDIVPLLKSVNDTRIVLLKVPGVQGFDRGRCHNIGINHAQGDIILNVDNDIFFSPLIFKVIQPEKVRNFHIIKELTKPRIGCYGTCIFFKYMWRTINGYAEGFNVWGCEDNNFYARLVGWGYRRIPDITTVEHIPHGDDLRLQHHDLKRKDSLKMHTVLRARPKAMHIPTYHTFKHPYELPEPLPENRKISL